MAGSASQEISRGRKIAAAAAMTATAGLVAREAIGHFSIEWLLLACAGILGIAGIGLTRRSLVVQVVSRGAAWIVLMPALLMIFFGALHGVLPPIEMGGLAAGTGLALLLARPMLHTKEAREAFAPKAFRRVFLAGSTASVSTALVAGAIAVDSLHGHHFLAAAFGALSASLFASAVGVVRMRGWGILLGALTSFVLLVCAVFLDRAESIALMLAAAPSLLLHLSPVLIARFRGTTPTERVRVSDVVEPAYAAAADPRFNGPFGLPPSPAADPQVRVATGDAADLDFDAPATADARAAAIRV